ncbi:hypothetical protein [Spirosoma endbachense]|uniref:DUF4595 domain-containing protein n=1 Tax=Spirosoma endbachense TaxID=2666025 RepID=A0A6P1VZI8_9BACT|nr:hypothetical protein [Spirosoma endbachense]QHV97502.1 hypothetical protein GJR95_21955 [Spirosoma endbachense]
MKRMYSAVRWPLGFILIGFIWLDGCKKSDDPGAQGSTNTLCKEVTIKATLLDLNYKFTFDDQLRIVGITVTDDGQTETRTYTYGSDGKLIDPSGDISTDYKNGLLDFVILDGALFEFNPAGQLTGARITTDDNDVLLYSYSYDANGDPVSIKGVITDSDGHTESDNYVLDYLADKLNGLPWSQQPQFAWLSPVFTAVPLTSKHLLNKWVRNWTAAGKSFTFTQQYTYTFDAQGRTTQFVHTGNPKNFFTITYAQCQ